MEAVHSDKKANEANAAKDVMLRSALDFIKAFSQKLGMEVHMSTEMLDMGHRTELSRHVERSIEDPSRSMMEASMAMDETVRSLIDRTFQQYFKKKSALLKSVHKLDTGDGSLFYYVELKESDRRNEKELSKIFDQYDRSVYHERFPVYFQFTPSEVVGKLKHVERVAIR